MKEILVQYAAYNLWANQRIVDVILKLDKSKQEQEVLSSFSSLRLTLQHMMLTEKIWWQRVKLIEATVVLQETGKTTEEIGKELIETGKLWKEWTEKSTVATFEHEFFYRNSKKEQFKQPVYQVMIHQFNHQTYHRGQLVTILKQLGVIEIPATDFIVFTRSKK